MRIHFVLNHDGTPASKLADIEIHFEDGLLAGLKLVGCTIWRSKKGDPPTVLVPSRSYATAGGIRYYELLRDSAGEEMPKEATKRFKKYIRDEYARIDTLPVEPETRPWGTSNDLAKSPQGLREKHMRTKKGAPTMAEKEAAQK